MNSAHRPLQVFVYQDVLCGWCYVADQRLDVLRRELGGTVKFIPRPYALRTAEGLPTAREVKVAITELQRAQKEAEGKRLSVELWQGTDLPRSSVATLAALEAARVQGAEQRQVFYKAMQHAALVEGINVTRADVLFELAEKLSLQMNRFAATFNSQETRRLILEEHRIATDRGVRGVPTLVIGGRWMVSGVREVSEYREHILGCLGKRERANFRTSESILH